MPEMPFAGNICAACLARIRLKADHRHERMLRRQLQHPPEGIVQRREIILGLFAAEIRQAGGLVNFLIKAAQRGKCRKLCGAAHFRHRSVMPQPVPRMMNDICIIVHSVPSCAVSADLPVALDRRGIFLEIHALEHRIFPVTALQTDKCLLQIPFLFQTALFRLPSAFQLRHIVK